MRNNLEQDIQVFLNKALTEINNSMGVTEQVSNCCSRMVYPDTDICSKCNEHCKIINI